MRLVFGYDNDVAAWVAAHIPYMQRGFGSASAIGIEEEGKLIAGCVYHDYQPEYKTMQLSIATTTPRWALRGNIKTFLSYPFQQVGVQKAWLATPHTNERAIRFVKGIGFKQEAVLARHFGDRHAVICRMFSNDFQRLFLEDSNGQKFTDAATGS